MLTEYPWCPPLLEPKDFEVEHGVHLLLADDPEAFAAACERLLTEPDLRKRLVDAAEELYLERYERSTARDRIQALVREVAGRPHCNDGLGDESASTCSGQPCLAR